MEPTTVGVDHIDLTDFGTYHKTALTRARLLTEEDFRKMGGVIQTLEGPVQFRPGDFLARGPKGEEWPIPDYRMALKTRVSEPDAEGWCMYRTNHLVRAKQMPGQFRVRIHTGDWLNGKAGDYLVISDGSVKIVDQEIFLINYVSVVAA